MRTLPLEYHFLTPFKSSNLLRLGIEKDGGYIVDQKFLKIQISLSLLEWQMNIPSK